MSSERATTLKDEQNDARRVGADVLQNVVKPQAQPRQARFGTSMAWALDEYADTLAKLAK